MINKKRFLVPAIIVLLLCTLFCGCGGQPIDLAELNRSCILVEQKEIHMTDAANGTAVLSITMPDYEKLYQAAAASPSFKQYMIHALRSGEYETVVFEETASVTVENNKQVVHSEEVISSLLDEQLVIAVEAATQEG